MSIITSFFVPLISWIITNIIPTKEAITESEISATAYAMKTVCRSSQKGKSYIEYQAEKKGTSWKGKLKEAVDLLISQIKDFEELLEKLQASGYEIKHGKYISCRAPGQERFTRLKTLGADYTEEAIRKRIAGIKSRTGKKLTKENGISLLIDIENNIKA